ncbi:hypothetical protein Pla52n_48060 [Stieleria varia]|uniref:Uncharacterized protein n=1 Tax=Stieleria varia TaxID=2528005 RepID=A0A5C6AGH9_9BACT|nr:hypothetical protein Pla52n_48060 [Stieleria varia]
MVLTSDLTSSLGFCLPLFQTLAVPSSILEDMTRSAMLLLVSVCDCLAMRWDRRSVSSHLIGDDLRGRYVPSSFASPMTFPWRTPLAVGRVATGWLRMSPTPLGPSHHSGGSEAESSVVFPAVCSRCPASRPSLSKATPVRGVRAKKWTGKKMLLFILMPYFLPTHFFAHALCSLPQRGFGRSCWA